MDHSYWHKKWELGDIGFHLQRPHPQLVKYWRQVCGGAKTVLVPLCGKSPDLLWLRSQGHEVVGIELSEIACKAFFDDNGIGFRKLELEGSTLFRGDGISIWCEDLFKVPKAAWQGCEAVYDRAALIALPEPVRAKYADTLVGNLATVSGSRSKISTFLISVEYPSPTPIGPPFSVSAAEVKALYGKYFNIECLDSRRDDWLSGKPPKFTGIEVTESAYHLKAR